MKRKTIFFDGTVFKKDILRFAPLWALYLAGGLLMAFGSGLHASALESSMGKMGVICFLYAMLAAQLLFGDLFDARLCHALHAIPLRREGWFLTHVTAGILFSLVPNLLIGLAMMLFLGQFWYTALIWLLVTELQYVFFFGLSVLCMMVSGTRLAAVTVYMILNFFALAVSWIDDTVFLPTHYGIINRTERYIPFLPLQGLSDESDYFTIIHSSNCWCRGQSGWDWSDPHIQYWGGFGTSWNYLIILAVIGLVAAVTALLLYRKRDLESAGDFIAFKWQKPVFAASFTFCAAAFAQKLGYEMEVPFYLFLILGLVMGYFISQILLHHSLRVFKRKNWVVLAVALALMLGAVGLCETDGFGIVRWTPDAEKVESVTVAQGRVKDMNSGNIKLLLEEPAQIRQLIQQHKLLCAEEQPDGFVKDRLEITICYTMKNGRQVYRYYRTEKTGEIAKWFQQQLDIGA